MDLSTLPIELVASIAKYLEHEELVRLRKTNAIVDLCGKLYGIGKRLPVYDCWFDLDDDEPTLTFSIQENVALAFNLNPLEETEFEYKFTKTDWQELLPIFNKIKVGNFTIENLTLCEESRLTWQIYVNAFKQCTSLGISNSTIDCSKDEFMSFLNIFPKALEFRTSNTDKTEYILNFEFLFSRKWENIRVSNRTPATYYELDDSVLDLIVTNSTALKLVKCHTRFSIQGVAKALTALSNELKCIGSSSWGILDDPDMKEDEALELLRAIPETKLDWNPAKRRVKTLIMFQSRYIALYIPIKFAKHPRMTVDFEVA